MRTRATLSAAEARRLALAAQGFATPRSELTADWRGLRRVVKRLGLLQIDSVNVLVRAHYLPLFSRLGPYERAHFDAKAYRRGTGGLFEYWAHEASLLPVEHQPLLRWRMARAERLEGMWSGIAKFARERRDYVDAVFARIAAEGPLTAAEFDERGPRRGTWWDRHDGKYALDYLFWAGKVTTTGRSNSFERSYDLPERVLPRQVLAVPTPSEADAQRELMCIAGRALGVATAKDLRDYFRMSPGDGQRAIDSLVESGDLLPVTVAGWRHQAYLDAQARIPRRIAVSALLVPFDPLIWERARTERLFDFRYRIEIYTPAPQRVHGYYVLPFLLGDALVARVDLKADRANATLRVHAAHGEPDIDSGAVAEALMAELRLLASWLGLERVSIGRRGDLAAALRAAARTRGAVAAQ
ncbi:MAG TPA: crosslink repair DNA glycosylase YcaQ family protein [Stellaceae bacterium]|nr:crosslink repair DNA glycosylase YcaQ family protein [Stellaceae bacterium]